MATWVHIARSWQGEPTGRPDIGMLHGHASPICKAVTLARPWQRKKTGTIEKGRLQGRDIQSARSGCALIEEKKSFEITLSSKDHLGTFLEGLEYLNPLFTSFWGLWHHHFRFSVFFQEGFRVFFLFYWCGFEETKKRNQPPKFSLLGIFAQGFWVGFLCLILFCIWIFNVAFND